MGKLVEVEGLEVFSLMDNCVDFLSSLDRKDAMSVRQWIKKLQKEKASLHGELPFAEHGFSMLIRVLNQKGHQFCFLFDTGVSKNGVVENAKRMGLDFGEVQSVVLSHGHYDHFGGLVEVLKKINRVDLPLIVHEDMFKKRGSVNVDGSVRAYPDFPDVNCLGLSKFVYTKEPYFMYENRVLVTGEIKRVTDFERGFLQHRVACGEKWVPDSLILDDRAVVFNVKKKGLVVISGCAHAGIVNSVLHAKKVTGVEQVYAVMGGFHLAGKQNQARIKRTVEELKKIDPKVVVGAHCTGWRGMCALAECFKEKFVWNSVGNFYKL